VECLGELTPLALDDGIEVDNIDGGDLVVHLYQNVGGIRSRFCRNFPSEADPYRYRQLSVVTMYFDWQMDPIFQSTAHGLRVTFS